MPGVKCKTLRSQMDWILRCIKSYLYLFSASMTSAGSVLRFGRSTVRRPAGTSAAIATKS